MRIIKEISIIKFIAQLVFLLLPTLAVVMFLLWNATQYLSLLQEQWVRQSLYFGLGMGLSFFLYQFRFRFLPTVLALVLTLFSISKVLDNYTFSEFDGFFIARQFELFSILFCLGWLCGWAYERVSYSAILISGMLLLVGIFLISKTGELTPYKLLTYFSPLALFAIYAIYTQSSLRQIEKGGFWFWIRYLGRMVVFVGVLLLLFRGVVYFLYPEIKERVEEYGGGAKEGEGDMLKRNKDGTAENKESMSLSGNNKKSNNPEPLFCAHIESFIPNTDIPNPLYLTSYHFSKYDSTTETFERDSASKYNDEFVPDPSKIPLFFTFKDSSRIRKERANKLKNTVSIEVYKKQLSPSSFIAPSTGFFVQPITVEKEYQTTFTSAYRAKSYVSDLNSAYFIYNSEDPNIRQFQEQRFAVLRKAKPYSTVDTGFLRYYTEFGHNGIYKPVKRLADSLAKGKTTTIDKVIAVRDYFLKRDELGERIYTYTDNPGIPGLPGASKLLYFLFDSKKGYCAYYAAATVFLLRSMNIPSRVVTGFLTVDRSDKNKGWYWFYEDQSHGWVQVYFPEYGWIDFDTTVGNDDAQQSPTPDGTPPLQPPNAVLAGKGLMQGIDTLKKVGKFHMTDLIYKDVEYHQVNRDVQLDLHAATIWKDSVRVRLSDMKPNDQVMVVSYAERMKAYTPEKDPQRLMDKFPSLLPIDDVYIKNKEEATPAPANEKPERSEGIWYYIKYTMGIAFLLFLLMFTLPALTLGYFVFRMRRAGKISAKAYYTYKASTFLLHQLGYERGSISVLTYAGQVIDPQLNAGLTSFTQIYLKQKYANQALTNQEANEVYLFYSSLHMAVKKHFSRFKRMTRFFNISRYIRYFGIAED